jgi:hypothetical protein
MNDMNENKVMDLIKLPITHDSNNRLFTLNTENDKKFIFDWGGKECKIVLKPEDVYDIIIKKVNEQIIDKIKKRTILELECYEILHLKNIRLKDYRLNKVNLLEQLHLGDVVLEKSSFKNPNGEVRYLLEAIKENSIAKELGFNNDVFFFKNDFNMKSAENFYFDWLNRKDSIKVSHEENRSNHRKGKNGR